MFWLLTELYHRFGAQHRKLIVCTVFHPAINPPCILLFTIIENYLDFLCSMNYDFIVLCGPVLSDSTNNNKYFKIADYNKQFTPLT